jgi:hypothetical protein
MLVVVNALWRQVDLATKMSMPWQELRNKPEYPDRGLLLDCISPSMPVGLWKAFKNGHWAVALSMLGTVLIMITTVSSTGFLVLETKAITEERTDFRQKSEVRLAEGFRGPYSGLPEAVQTWRGIHEYGLSYPLGTSEDTVLPHIELPNPSFDIHEVWTRVEGLKIDCDCEILPIANATTDELSWSFYADVSVQGCTSIGQTQLINRHNPLIQDETRDTTPADKGQFRSGLFFPISCDPDVNGPSLGPQGHFLITSADLKWKKGAEESSSREDWYIDQLVVIYCKASYSMRTFDSGKPSPRNRSSQAVLSTLDHGATETAQGISELDFGTLIHSSVRSVMLNGERMTGNPFFRLMLSLNPELSSKALLDPETLRTASRDVIRGVTTQILHAVAVQPVDRNFTGRIEVLQERLQVTEHSMAVMCSLMGLLVILPVALALVRPQANVITAPDSIAAMALIFASGPVARAYTHHWKFPPIQEKQTVPKKVGHARTSWWRPLAGTHWFFAIAVVLPLASIASLEAMYRVSKKKNGLGYINTYQTAVFTAYIPAAVAVSIAALYSSLKFTTALLTPFVALSRGKATVSRA